MKRVLAAASVALAGVFLMASPVLADTTISPNPIPVTATAKNATVTVTYSGMAANKALFISQCEKPTSDPTFDPIASCSNLSVIQVNPSDNPTGSGTVQFKVFHGAEPSGDDDWGCLGTGESAPAGVTNALTTCYVRISSDTQANITGQQATAFTFNVGDVNPPPDVPESGLPIALPLIGVAVVGATLITMRRRRTRAVV